MEPQDFDSYRVPISKTSGKETAFIIFVNREGKRKFMNEHGHRYSARNGNDMAIMHNYWMSTDQSTKDYYKTIELSDHNSLENRTKRRHEHENRRRIIAHQKAEEEYETRQTHRANVQFQQNEKLRARGPQFIPDPKRAWDANTLFEKDFTEYCMKRRKELSELFKNKLESPDPSNLAELREETFCFVGVSICGYSEIVNEDVKKEDLYTVPREISIVNFTLKAGITSVKTILLDANPGIYNPDFNEEFQKDNIRETSEYLGLKPPIYEQGKEDVEDAWHMFKAAWGTRKKNSTEKARILCEKKFFNIVSFTFNRIANIAGMAEWRIHSESIQKGMVPIEDFILALKDAASCSIPDADVLEKYVQKNYVPRLRDEHYCSVHIHQEGDKDLRCQQARGAMAIHGLFAFLRDQKIFGFNEEYDEILHNLCTERKKKIAEPATGNNFLEVGYRRSNRYLDFTLVPSITAKDPTPDTRHMSQFRRAFDNPTSSKWRQPLLEEEDDDDERPNEDEGRAADENDSKEEGLPPIRRRPFNQNEFDQSYSNRAPSVHGATFGIDSNNQQQSFKQNNFAASSRSHVPIAHKPNQKNWTDPSLLSRPATVSSIYRSGIALSYWTACETSGGFRNEPSCQESFQSRPQSTNSFQPQFQGSFQNRPSSTNSFLQQSRGGFQNQASGAQGGSQIVRPGYTTTRASPPQHRKFIPNHDISKPKNTFSPRYNFSYNVKINWRPYTGDITKEKLLCPDGLIDPFNYESFPNALA